MTQDTLLITALQLFAQQGVKQMTMDDLSHACGISKKTLYGEYDNKAQLVDAAVLHLLAELEQLVSLNQKNSSNAIEETLQLLEYFENICKECNFRMLVDLKKYYYTSWLKIEAFRKGFWYKIIISNLERGQAEALYTDTFDNNIIAHMRSQQLSIMHEEAMQNPALHQALIQITLHYLKGIATKRGLSLIEKLQTTSNTI